MNLKSLMILLFGGLIASACSGGAEASADRADEVAVLVFTAIPDSNSTELAQKFEPVAKYLSEKLGVPVSYLPTSSYDASVESFKNGDVQLAWFGGLTGVQARDAVPGSKAIAQGKVDPHFRTYFIAHKDAGIAPSEGFPMDLKGKSFTFGSRRSTSGRLMPEYFIREHSGQSPNDFFGSLSHFSGSHDTTAKLVESGAYQAGALNYATYDSMVAKGELDSNLCIKIWTTPPFADYNWSAHPSLDRTYGEGFINQLREALVGMTDPQLLSAISRPDGIIEASDDDFSSIQTLARELGFIDS
jgi:phosphonate transport system substrate-binding protein